MDIITKAKELGMLIAASEEMTALKKAEAQVEQDANSKKLFDEYKLLQKELSKAIREKTSSEAIGNINEKLERKQEEIDNYGITRNFLEAKASFDKLMKTINDIMIFIITGEEPCSSSGNCGSCGGCNH